MTLNFYIFRRFCLISLPTFFISLSTGYNCTCIWQDVFKFSLIQTKTEFLLIIFSAQPSKMSDPSLLIPLNIKIPPFNSARNLWDIFDSTPSQCRIIFLLYPNPSLVCYLSVTFGETRLTLLLPKLCYYYIFHLKLDYCNSLFLNLPQSATWSVVSNLFWILQLEQFLKLLNFVTSLLFSNLFIGLKLNKESNSKLSPSPTKLFNPRSLAISIKCSIFNAIDSLVPLMWLHYNALRWSLV